MKNFTLTAIGVLLTASLLLAHHSYGMFFDVDQRVTLKGQVAKVSFRDPHVMLTIETKKSGTWEAEWTSPNNLTRQQVSVDTIKAGDFLEIEGSPARNPDARCVRSEGDPAPRRRLALAGPRIIE